jgi:hypothetical protein
LFGAAIIAFLALAAAVAVAGIVHGLRMPAARGAKADLAWLTLRWLAAALLAASAIWIVVAPRADQPVLDLLERVFPAVRAAYMSDEGKPAATQEPAAQTEARARARESRRWWIALVFAAFALALVVSKIAIPGLRNLAAPARSNPHDVR